MKLGQFQFNRLEFAGSLADLGTLLPLLIGLIVINGLNPTSVLFMIGIFYILSGTYYRIPVSVQPMKVIAAYAIAMGMSQVEISASTIIIGIILLILGITKLIRLIGKYIPHMVVRGVQFGVGSILIYKGISLVLKSDSDLVIQNVGPVSIGVILGGIGVILTLILLKNKRFPAAIVIVFLGIMVGIFMGKPIDGEIQVGIYLPKLFPYGIPGKTDLLIGLTLLVIPQIPMTTSNAIISNCDLSKEYFGKKAKKMSYTSLANSMGLGNVVSFILGGMPMCHGSGGIAAHYRFGSRTAGSNLIIGSIFLGLGLFFGPSALHLLDLIPLSLLGVLLIFAGIQLCLMIKDVKDKINLALIFFMLLVALTINLSISFILGIILAYTIKKFKLKI
jgi:SulP family sulfate permease|tara:strand:+ start:566 stop:1735 length:1170 start_codon:yes stop_codon:yes gene_type:complete